MERSKKRKREVDNPRITYHALTRTFDRLFKEESLAEMKEVARRKLGLSSTTSVGLVQIRDGKTIDLDDDDDFDAFYAVAHSTSLVDVQVIIGPEATMPESDSPGKKKRKKTNSSVILSGDMPDSEETGQLIHVTEAIPTNQHVVSVTGTGTGKVDISESVSAPPKKKRKKKMGTIADSIEAHVPFVETSVPRIVPPSSKRHGQDLDVVVQERGVGESKNARRRKQKLPRQRSSTPLQNNTNPGAQDVATPDESTKEHPTGKPPETREIQLAEQLACAISKSNEMNQRHSGASSIVDTARSSTRAKSTIDPRPTVTSTAAGKGTRRHENRPKLDTDESEQRETPTTTSIITESNRSNGAARRSKTQARLSKADELEAANADVKATAIRILAAKRATLAEETATNVQSRGTINSACVSNRPETRGVEGHPVASLLNGITGRGGGSPCAVVPANLATANDTPAPAPQSSAHPSHKKLRSANSGPPLPSASSSVVAQRLAFDLSPIFDSVSMSNDVSDSRPSTVASLAVGDTYANDDLDAIIRGPKIPLIIADIASPDSSDEEEEEYLELEEDTQEEQSSSRRSKWQVRDSSVEETDVEIDDEDSSEGGIDEYNRPTSPQGGSALVTPFRVVDTLGLSRIDDSGNTHFKGTLKEDDTIPHPVDEGMMRSPDVAQHAGANHLSFATTSSTTQASAHVPLPAHLGTTDFTFTSTANVLEELADVLPSRGVETSEAPPRNGVSQRKGGRDAKAGQGKINSATPSKSQHPSDNEEPGNQRNIAKRTRSAVALGLLMPPFQTPGVDNRHNSHSSASVPPAKRKVQQIAMADVPALTPAPPRDASAKALSEAQSSVPKSVSLGTWVTLKPSSPPPDADSTTMIDELESSSPVGGSPALDRHSPAREPLFILTESQAPFPYSQWTGTAPEEDHQVVSNDSDDEGGMKLSIESRSHTKSSKYRAYRTLTDITSQQSLFSTPPTLQSTQPRTAKHKLADLYGPQSQAGGESESESESEPESKTDPDSDSDVATLQEKSHIPEGRRAGVSQKRKK